MREQWRTLLMGPAQPWHYKMGETNLFCLHQSGPQAVQHSFHSRNRCWAPALMWGHPIKEDPLIIPPLAMHAHPTKLTPQSRVMGDSSQTSVLCSKLGLRWRRKSSTINLHPNPKSTDCGGFWIRPYIQYFIWKLQTHTTDMTTEQHRGRKREKQALGRASRGHQTVQVCRHIPHA